jgi:hypothetical protein
MQTELVTNERSQLMREELAALIARRQALYDSMYTDKTTSTGEFNFREQIEPPVDFAVLSMQYERMGRRCDHLAARICELEENEADKARAIADLPEL